jgi:cation/acetate symporter
VIYEPSSVAVAVFVLFVAITLGLSFYLGRRAKSSQGYFAAHGQIPWFINGVAFAGDYLSAASFLGICGMIAFYGYDGFLYSIGFLAGWIVALFVVAEPIKRLGKFTFADALDAKFGSRGIKLAAGTSTLVVSIFYLIPQMVGAGALVQPLLGFPHWMGVLLVGTIVVVIVVTAGMVSTTYVQFLKGSLLVIFSAVLSIMILTRGLEVQPGGKDGHAFRSLGPFPARRLTDTLRVTYPNWEVLPPEAGWADQPYVRTRDLDKAPQTVWRIEDAGSDEVRLTEAQTVTTLASGQTLVNGEVKGTRAGERQLHPVGHVIELPDGQSHTGPLGPLAFLRTLQQSVVVLWGNQKVVEESGEVTTVYYQRPTPGSRILRPGEHPTFRGIRSERISDKLDFISLMLALFCGTASLPHILIRYYTVKDEQSARRSTIVGIASIGFFYVLTLYLGLGAMTSGAMDVTDSNMAAPLLAKGMNEWLFAIISAIAFTTVLGTVSGLILASSGAVTHDLLVNVLGVQLTDTQQVRVAKLAAVVVGLLAIVLGILFQNMNVGYLVGWAFSIAASANLPALMMLLFWPRTTHQGVIWAVVVGMISSLGWILLSADTFINVYGLPGDLALAPLSQPGIVTIPVGFVTLVVVSLMTSPRPASDAESMGAR